MRTMNVLFCLVLLALVIAGCAGSKTTTTTTQSGSTGVPQAQAPPGVPDWFVNVPNDPNFLFAATTTTSRDMGLAVENALTAGRAEIARQTEVRVQALQKRFQEETGFEKDAQLLQQFTSATKTVVSTSLSGSKPRKQLPVQVGEIYRAYVLTEYPVGAANQALIQQIKGNEQLYTRFRASQTYKELEDEVQKYDEWKKQQGQTPR